MLVHMVYSIRWWWKYYNTIVQYRVLCMNVIPGLLSCCVELMNKWLVLRSVLNNLIFVGVHILVLRRYDLCVDTTFGRMEKHFAPLALTSFRLLCHAQSPKCPICWMTWIANYLSFFSSTIMSQYNEMLNIYSFLHFIARLFWC